MENIRARLSIKSASIDYSQPYCKVHKSLLLVIYVLGNRGLGPVKDVS